jgi:hypothetical protein
MHDIWWNLLRTRIRQVPRDERRRWTDKDIAAWLVKFSGDPVVSQRKGPLPSLEHAKRVCGDLIGSDIVE